MREFSVWAPRPSSVSLATGGAGSGIDTVTPMTAGENGWWHAAVDTAAGAGGAELDYAFLLDDDPRPRPDPRSRRQPAGVHGPSRTADPEDVDWTDGDWTGRQLAGGTIYELHIGTFTEQGTFDAAVERLGHLVDLGVDFVELLPVNAFNGAHNWGYDGVLWFAVHEPYGGPAGYRRFVDACHARGLGVIQDVVYNHLGPSGNYLPLFGPYLHDNGRRSTWGQAVNLDGPGSDEVRRYIVDNAEMWLRDYHVDGLRLDAVHALVDHRAVHLLEELAERTDALSTQLGRPLSLIAESDLADPRLITPRAAGGYGLTAQWNDDYHHAIHVALTGETAGYYADFGAPPGPLTAIGKVLTSGFFHDGTHSSFRGRHHGRPLDTRTVPATALLGYAQDHDQIGNRATGDRLSATLDDGQLKVAAVLVLAAPFTPMLFMGEEWAASTPWQFFTSHPEPELGEATARGRLEEFARMGWDRSCVPDPQDPATFVRSQLNWSERSSEPHAEILAVHRDLLALRRRWPQLTDPRFERTTVRLDEAAGWLLMDRDGLQVLVNAADRERTVPVQPHGAALLATDPGVAVGARQARMPPHSALLLAPVPHTGSACPRG